MKILYVSQYFPPEMGAPAARVYELAKRWVQEGHQVTVLTGFPNHPTGVVPAEYRSKWKRLVSKEKVDGINLVRVWLMPLPNRKVHERILNYGSFWLSSSLAGMFLKRPDVVIGTSPQLLVGLTGWWLARAKFAPFVFEVRDLWPESLTAVGVSGRDSVLYRTLGAVAKFLYRRCDHLVVVTPAFKEYLRTNWGISSERMSVVENGVETELFGAGEANRVRRQLGVEDRLVVSYVGTLGMAHGLDTVLDAAERLLGSELQLTFLLVGEGAEKQRLREMAARRGLKNVIFMDEKPRAQMPDIIRASDACLVTLRKSEIFTTVIPTKLLEFMSCGRPVILAVNGQAREFVDSAQAGLYVEPENAEALADAVCQLAADPDLRQRLGSNGRQWTVEHLSRDKTAEKYLDVLDRVRSHHLPTSEQSPLNGCDSSEKVAAL